MKITATNGVLHTQPGYFCQPDERNAIKAAGWTFHWKDKGPRGGSKCRSGCLGCIKSLPGNVWVSDSYEVEGLPVELDSKAAQLVNRALQATDESWQEDADIDVPAPEGLAYMPYQLAAIKYAKDRKRVLFGDQMGLGKGQPKNSKVLTPNGWRRIGDLSIGDKIVGSDGKSYTVTGVYDRGELEVFKVSFNDKTDVIVDGDHLWKTRTAQQQWAGSDWKTIKTSDLSTRVKDSNGNFLWRIPVAESVSCFESDKCGSILHPYILGVLLGDGSLAHNPATYTPGDEDVPRIVASLIPSCCSQTETHQDKRTTAYKIVTYPKHAPNPVLDEMRRLELSGIPSEARHVPKEYLFTNEESRLKLLQGLLDTDGESRKDTVIEFASASRQLVEDVAFLCRSLGGIARHGATRIGKYKKDGKVVECKKSFRIRLSFPPDVCPFWAQKDRYVPKTKYLPNKIIRSIEPCGIADVVCISVDSPDRCYVTEGFAVTHNTVEALGWANYHTDVNTILVVCPASLKLNWERELLKWFVRPAHTHVVMDNEPVPAAANIVIVNYERLIGKRSEKLMQSLMVREWDMFILDEAHKIKTKTAQRSVAILGGKGSPGLMSRASRLAFLTGTPIPNRPRELFPIASSLDPDAFANEWKFKMRYCGPRQDTIWQKGPGGAYQKQVYNFDGASNLPELQRKLRSSFMVRRLKKDVLTELPDKIRHVIPIPADAKTQKLLREMELTYGRDPQIDKLRGRALVAAGTKVNYEAAQEALHKATVQLFIHQMAKERKALGEAKLPMAIEHIKNVIEDGQKLVVFAHHHSVIEALQNEFGDLAVSLYGPTKEEDRLEAIDRFQNDDDVKIFIGSIQAAGVGITLTASDRVLFVESSWVPSDISQCEDRVHRLGQKKGVLIEHLIIDQSLEATMTLRVLEKQAILDEALDVLS